MDKIFEIENLIPKEYCDYAILYFSNIANNQPEKIMIWHTSFAYGITADPDFNDPIIKEMSNIIEDLVINHILKDSNTVADYSDIVFRDKGSYHPIHLDKQYQNYSSILYLNDDYVGGETVFETGKTVKPRTGKFLGFCGNKTKHKVNEVLSGHRYAMATWYRQKEHKI